MFKKKRDLVVKEPRLPVTADDVKKYIRAFMPSSGLTDNEVMAFTEMAKLHGLNPWKREIYCIPYEANVRLPNGSWGKERKLSIVTGYQVYLQRAEATGKLDGFKTVFEGEGDKMSCTIIIKRKDMNGVIEHTVYREEWDTKKSIWAKAPRFMLEKMAIGQGFRKAFPNELGGMPYTEEEMSWTEEKSAKTEMKAEMDDLKKKTVGEIVREKTEEVFDVAFSGAVEPAEKSPERLDRASVVKLLPKSGLDGMGKAKMFARIQEASDAELQEIYKELGGK